MNPTPKFRALKWLNIFLLIINISAFGTMLYLNSPGKGKDNDNDAGEKVSSLDFLKKELDLSKDQYKEISRLDEEVFNTYHQLIEKICDVNFATMDELSKDYPSEIVLDSLAMRIGTLNALLRQQTIRHFLNVKSICNDNQKEEMSFLFKEMMELDKQCKICNKKECPRRKKLEEMKK